LARRYFGTDGVRGVVGEDLTPELVERLGRAVTLWSKGGRVFVGRDTRGSGEQLEEAFGRGVVAAGGNAVLAGVPGANSLRRAPQPAMRSARALWSAG
jgi:phosphomannomutase